MDRIVRGHSVNEIDTTWIDEQIGYLLRRASAAMASDYAAEAPYGSLRPVQVTILSLVEANPGIGSAQLCRVLGIQRSNIVPLVGGLVDAGFLDRQPSTTDGRRHELDLTDAGRVALEAGREVVAEHEARMTGRLDAVERARLRALLKKIIP